MSGFTEKKTNSRFISISPVNGKEMLEEARQLFLEYARSLDVDLCFQNFEEELNSLSEKYGPPDGTILLAYADGKPAGCAALHKLSDGICEMKRLYVRESCRDLGLGKMLIARILDEATEKKYRFIRLDTLPTMNKAQKLYEAFGFYDIDPYVYNPITGSRYLEKKL
jgi:ribosomal protein S18 acetylase RimI-like enzyme